MTTEVSKVAVLPSGEDPVIASVSDVVKLKGKPFFANAQDGDRVLIYKQAKKAILYRPRCIILRNAEATLHQS